MDRSKMQKRRPNRLTDYDYSQPGCYFVTVCTQGRAHLFWKNDFIASVGAACGRPPLSEFGWCVERKIDALNKTYNALCVDKYVIMPNHIHMILRILQTKDGRPQAAPTIGRAINQFKGAVTKSIGRPIWQKGYHDHILRTDDEYLRVWDYIHTNPAKWRADCYFTETEG